MQHILAENLVTPLLSDWEIGLCFGVVLGVYYWVAPADPGEWAFFWFFSLNKVLPAASYF